MVTHALPQPRACTGPRPAPSAPVAGTAAARRRPAAPAAPPQPLPPGRRNAGRMAQRPSSPALGGRPRSRVQPPRASSSDEAGGGLLSDDEPPPGAQHLHARMPLLSAINEATKWVVSAAVMAVMLLRLHDAAMAWAVVGAVASVVLCKVLKRLINEQRPATARKADPGMPSSHANSLSFLGCSAALAVAPHSMPAAASIVAASLFLTWPRVALGYHTTPQVVVGYGLGASTAAAWHWAGQRYTLPVVSEQPAARAALYALLALAVVFFTIRNVRSWQRERRRQQRGGDGGGAGGGKLAAA